jgi:hypothetical protein
MRQKFVRRHVLWGLLWLAVAVVSIQPAMTFLREYVAYLRSTIV